MPGGRPAKPIELVKGHRTKAEIETRKKAEQEILTGSALREWPEVKADPIAHKEFMRLRKLLKTINYNDDLWGTMINTLAKLKAEEHQFIEQQVKLREMMDQLQDIYSKGEMEFIDYLDRQTKLTGKINDLDGKIMAKRKMTLDISKENIMTIQGALRSIPKKPEEKKESQMAEFLKRKQAGGNNAT